MVIKSIYIVGDKTGVENSIFVTENVTIFN